MFLTRGTHSTALTRTVVRLLEAKRHLGLHLRGQLPSSATECAIHMPAVGKFAGLSSRRIDESSPFAVGRGVGQGVPEHPPISAPPKTTTPVRGVARSAR